MSKELEKYNWSEWLHFPDPRKGEILTAPFGYGLYQLKNISSEEFILFGTGKNCALRMTSLLPSPFGQGRRNNNFKREYIFDNISSIEYRTISFLNREDMNCTEKEIKKLKIHKYNT
ncbi:MAG: hypothetical protein EOO44_07870 [Flavobacterium sp.]|nr:MAG: hypothetical protein EOO44_07870 [Flavobacterium sp.]